MEKSFDSFEAVYIDGVFRPLAPVADLSNGQRVWLTVQDVSAARAAEQQFLRHMEAEGLLVRPPIVEDAGLRPGLRTGQPGTGRVSSGWPAR
jgi:predicted DNA-binding antitoxin AbrB/MazE fold protein